MKKIIIIFLFFVFSLSLTGCEPLYKLRSIFRFGEKEEFNYGVTALQWQPFIEKRAKQWRPDANIYGISETEVTVDGLSDKWEFLYYSPGSEKTAMIIYESGFISAKEIIMQPLNSVAKFKIDSPTAINIANKNGGSEFIKNNKNVSLILSLAGGKFESRNRRAIWTIRYYGDTNILIIKINANNGKLISKK